ncbi:hypothetical protein VIBNISOn1_200001 [Vibrio nigripulchritudo SOn1]|uniref:Uncharacterized protein n=1 Tax=Vibrio nigripulchritudo SOn1 TaxID=1238450 RepID=A0AAV2VR31_9VIBR|nr:hypothetical protein VIBNISOn1_200001 [Vibrio nigripulchritudo SOn1]
MLTGRITIYWRIQTAKLDIYPVPEYYHFESQKLRRTLCSG